MLDKTITLKELLICITYLIIAFSVSGYFSAHQIIDTKAIFSGPILGTLVTFFMALYFVFTKKKQQQRK